MTDQQRWDTIAALGSPYMVTPCLDRLCGGGVSFTSAFAPGATCISSRAAVFTGMYPHNTGVYAFDNWSHQHTWVADLANAGYRCVNIGKMHLSPIYADGGFHERIVVENKCEDFHGQGIEEDEWCKFLAAHGIERPQNRADIYPDWKHRLNSVGWEHEERFHSDSFVGDTAVRWISEYDGDRPFFLQIGFPGPHEPYDPPKRFLDLYRDADVPAAVGDEGELDEKPPQQKALSKWFRETPNNAVIDYENASGDEILEMRRHYYANISLIDEKVGGIIDALKASGALDNTIVLFVSDHGDSLGDHKLPYKWLMYDSMVRVPFIIRDFRGNTCPAVIDELVSIIDIGPTILDYAGCPVPPYAEGRSLTECVDRGTLREHAPYVFCENNYVVMVRSNAHKMVYYIGQDYGELYDLGADPDELVNLWESADHAHVKTELKSVLLDWLARSNYFNAGYKNAAPENHSIRWPGSDKFGDYLQGRPKS